MYLCTKLFVMAKPFYFTIQSWMLEDMNLPLSDAAVYAYIHGLTNSEALGKQGWSGSVRQMAEILHTPHSTLNAIINRLKSKSYIRIVKGHILSNINRDITPKTPTVQNLDTNPPASGNGVPF